jgi:hypothetical protein
VLAVDVARFGGEVSSEYLHAVCSLICVLDKCETKGRVVRCS